MAAPSAAWLIAVPLALAAGWVKGRYVLAPRAEVNADRIVRTEEARCVGGVFSWTTWALVVVMMGTGIALRHSWAPRHWLGVLYTAVGSALLTASARGWRIWHRFRA